jgi:hypothetical protein
MNMYFNLHGIVSHDDVFKSMSNAISFQNCLLPPPSNISIFYLSSRRNESQPSTVSVEQVTAYTNSAMEAVNSSYLTSISDSRKALMDGVIATLRNMSFEEQNHVMNTVHGREFPYPLSCPPNILNTTNYSVIVAYHIGMLKNWRDVVTEQLTTLEICGLGRGMTKMIITYSSKNDTENSFEELHRIVYRYTFASKVTFHNSSNLLPYEGLAMNLLRDYCMAQEQEIVAFYIHSKGCSHFHPKWRDPGMMQEWGSYINVLFWRKYLEYFLIERPGICIHHILNEGFDACGPHLMDDSFFYGGNFWAASCSHLKTLTSMQLENVDEVRARRHDYEKKYAEAERWIGLPTTPRNLKFISVHEFNHTHGGLYKRPSPPDEYSDYSYRWNLEN